MAEPVLFEKGRLVLLDQRKLPGRKTYLKFSTASAAAKAIKTMVVRGAPAIGVAAAYGMVLGYGNPEKSAKILMKSRPTAVNLRWAVEKMLAAASLGREAMLAQAKKIDKENRALSRKIARAGAALIKNGSSVMTHCNAGPLAVGGLGTALGVIYAARKKIKTVFVKETRPRMQGARLTTWELREWKIPYVLITDGMDAHIMKTRKIGAVIVGADRIAANGDTANKIGTYSLSLSAAYHRVPFYVAAPYSTIDFSADNGNGIVIEERSQDEVLKINGAPVSAAGTRAANPAFDVTPAKLITAIITERGIIRKPSRVRIEKMYGRGR